MLTWTLTTDKPHPDKPGKANYEQIRCLVVYRGETLLRLWNCEHLCWDDEEGDDWFCDVDDVTAWMLAPEPPVDAKRAFGPDYANRILWFSKGYGAFRITEDGTTADVDDNLIPLPPQPWISAIPDDVGPIQWDRWMQIFNDYDIISPIGQWSRGKK